jgi:uncharacterized protein
MFPEMRLQKRQVTRQEAEDILSRGLYGVLAINGGGAYAYGVPLSYVYLDNRIYLHCAPEGRKLTLLRQDHQVCFCVVQEAEPLADRFSMKYQSAMAFGRAREIEDNEEKMAALIAVVEKYYPDGERRRKGRQYAAESLHKTIVIRLDIDYLTGKARK